MYDERNRLRDVCTREGGHFFNILNGNVYCKLAYTRRVECEFCDDKKDKNGLYLCTYKEYERLRDELLYENLRKM